jgi:hypothetical protein
MAQRNSPYCKMFYQTLDKKLTNHVLYSSRDRTRCLHGRIRFSLTGSSRLEGGSTTPNRFVVMCMAAPPMPHLLKRRDPTARSTARAFHHVYGRLDGARKSQRGYGGERRSSWWKHCLVHFVLTPTRLVPCPSFWRCCWGTTARR